jgi:hypothetical protein
MVAIPLERTPDLGPPVVTEKADCETQCWGALRLCHTGGVEQRDGWFSATATDWALLTSWPIPIYVLLQTLTVYSLQGV